MVTGTESGAVDQLRNNPSPSLTPWGGGEGEDGRYQGGTSDRQTQTEVQERGVITDTGDELSNENRGPDERENHGKKANAACLRGYVVDDLEPEWEVVYCCFNSASIQFHQQRETIITH